MLNFFKETEGIYVSVFLLLVLIAVMFFALAVGTVKIPME